MTESPPLKTRVPVQATARTLIVARAGVTEGQKRGIAARLVKGLGELES